MTVAELQKQLDIMRSNISKVDIDVCDKKDNDFDELFNQLQEIFKRDRDAKSR